ncbi:hypothetical protein WJX74_001575 [Apatococcus lobatus]|uniref:sn-1-specific diacylglycerol lipase n=1 Tax=Apatococcus lobatus TaxID=904363 RepID=A0AAW1RB99_9CHLO
MPSFRIAGSEWHIASDMLPLPHIVGLIFHVVWVIVFGSLIGVYDVFRTCSGQGGNYVAADAGLLTIFCVLSLCEVAIIVIGFRGTPLQVSKRQAMVPVLYVQAFFWLGQGVFMVYGTVVVEHVQPTCWPDPVQQAQVHRVSRAMVYSTWGFTVFLGLMLLLFHSAYPGRDRSKQAEWEKRCKCLSSTFGCAKEMTSKIEGRDAPLRSITEVIAQLFEGVNLSPSDMTAALVLVAAAQHRRRKVQIENALERTAGTSTSMTETPDLADVADPKLFQRKSYKKSGSGKGMQLKEGQPGRVFLDGIKEQPSSALPEDAYTGVAMPQNIPDKWKAVAEEKYEESGVMANGGPNHTVQDISSVSESIAERKDAAALGTKTHESAQSGPGTQATIEETVDETPVEGLHNVTGSAAAGLTHLQNGHTHSPHPAGHAALQQSAAAGPSPHAVGADYDGVGGYPIDGVAPGSSATELPAASSPAAGPGSAGEQFTRVVSLAQIPESALKGLTRRPNRQGFESGSRFGVDSAHSEADADMDVEAGSALPAGLQHDREMRHQIPGAQSMQRTPFQDAQLPDFDKDEEEDAFPGTANLGQEGSATGSFQQRQEAPFITASQLERYPTRLQAEGLQDSEGKSLDLDRPPGGIANEQEDNFNSAVEDGVQQEKELKKGESEEPFADGTEPAIPLERQISHKYQTLITPSEQVEELRGGMAASEAVEGYLGGRDSVPHPLLKEARHWMKFAVAAYYAQDATATSAGAETPAGMGDSKKAPGCSYGCAGGCCCGLCCHRGVTAQEVRDIILKEAEILDEDLLHYSHNNAVGGHLPYIIALDRVKKKIVLGIRGTSSLADIITDAVVHPDNIDDWVPKDFKQKNMKRGTMLAHAGMVGAAGAILKDLDDLGILPTLILGKSAGKAAAGEGKGQDVGAVMSTALDTKGWSLVITGHSLGAGVAALMALKLKDRFPDLVAWAFCPPGSLVSKSLIKPMQKFCFSVVCGKDAVPRMSVGNVARLMDEMVTSLARCKRHKLQVLFGSYWNKQKRPDSDALFHSYEDIPREPKLILANYHQGTERKEKALEMFPPGRIVFLRPLKVLVKTKSTVEPKASILPTMNGSKKASSNDDDDDEDDDRFTAKLEKRWDAVWVSARELMGEGILVSRHMLEDHLVDKTVAQALTYSLNHHPDKGTFTLDDAVTELPPGTVDLRQVVVVQPPVE